MESTIIFNENTLTSTTENTYVLCKRIKCASMRKSLLLLLLWRCDPTRAMASSFLRFLDHTQRRITFGRTPLDEWSARRRDLYLTTHNTHNRQTSMPPVGFEPTISGGERPQTYALDRAVTGTGLQSMCFLIYYETSQNKVKELKPKTVFIRFTTSYCIIYYY